MLERRSLRWPITLGVVMIVLLVALTVGWVLLSVYGALGDRNLAALYWTLLTVGATFLVVLLLGVIVYLTLTIKAINLNRRQSNFIDSVTHELKSPIASLKLYLQTLNRRPVTMEQQAEFNRAMLDDVERLDQLINHLLDAARLDRLPTADDTEDVEIAAIIRDCVQEILVRYRLDPSCIELDLCPGIVVARQVDVDMIFRNLLDNAVKYSSPNPRVQVTMRETGMHVNGRRVTGFGSRSRPRVEIRIADNGVGIPAHQRRKIFGRFVRLGSELERKKPGTGLGLYIVRTLVSRIRGRIRVQDRGREPGTIFIMELPLKPRSPESPPTLRHSSAETPPSSENAPAPKTATRALSPANST